MSGLALNEAWMPASCSCGIITSIVVCRSGLFAVVSIWIASGPRCGCV